MPLTTRLSNYRDVEQVLKAAVRAGGGKLTFPSKSVATRFRSRIYRYLQLMDGSNPAYDSFQFTIEGSVVVMALVHFAAQFEDHEGNAVAVDAAPAARAEPHISQDDDLLNAALDLRRSMERKPEE